MTRTRIKICGFRDSEPLLQAIGPVVGTSYPNNWTYYGLNFVNKSPRYITVGQADQLLEDFWDNGWKRSMLPVLLFSDETPEQVTSVAIDLFRYAWDAFCIQLHGNESPEYVQSLPEEARIVKAVPFDLDEIDRWRGNDRLYGLLIDAPKIEGEPAGGTGRTADWSALAGLDKSGLPEKLFLAGGLTPENVAEAVEVVRPYAVDVSSGVESSRGVKDAVKIAAFCEAVRRADARSD